MKDIHIEPLAKKSRKIWTITVLITFGLLMIGDSVFAMAMKDDSGENRKKAVPNVTSVDYT